MSHAWPTSCHSPCQITVCKIRFTLDRHVSVGGVEAGVVSLVEAALSLVIRRSLSVRANAGEPPSGPHT
jgi:hypothetical protein